MDAEIKTFWKRVKRTYNPKWCIVVLSKGDIRHTINRNFSRYTQRFLNIISRMGGIYTVLWMRKSDLEKWKAVKGVAAFRQCLGEVFAEEDGRRLFPNIHKVADEIKRIRKQTAKSRKHHLGEPQKEI